MGILKQHDSPPLPQPPASPRRSHASSLRGRRIRQVLELPSNMERTSSWSTSTNQTLDEVEPFFEKKLHLGSERPKLPKIKARSPSPVTSICSVDTHSPSELRAMSQRPISTPFTPTPPPPPTADPLTGRVPLPPIMSANLSGACKEVADGWKFQSPKAKVEEFVEQFHLVHLPSPRPPTAPHRGTNFSSIKADEGARWDKLKPLPCLQRTCPSASTSSTDKKCSRDLFSRGSLPTCGITSSK
ncbi:uncharacterized protein B0353.1-like [Thunnus albacares]|uniref:uncharacterized protein B0353.1-like n=1 Tax=Thunnus albacares TaxID=8236 RepID=UPI001CF6B31F|nr:uncharacterized protein B0353.1-like [Thunnus albacares]